MRHWGFGIVGCRDWSLRLRLSFLRIESFALEIAIPLYAPLTSVRIWEFPKIGNPDTVP